MGGLLKNWTNKWASKRAIGKSQQSRERQTALFFTSFSTIMPVLPPTKLSNFRPPNKMIYSYGRAGFALLRQRFLHAL